MTKLNQIVAVVNGKKTEAQKAITEVHRKSSAVDLFSGLTRIYRPLDEDGERMPNEVKHIQFTADQALKECADILTNLFDVVATQDYNNGDARADVIVDGEIILDQVPVTYLLFLEKQLVDVGTFIAKLPTLDSGESWMKDANTGHYVSDSYETMRNRKVLQHKVLYEATKEHPAQVEKWTEDVPVGKYINTKYSGAISPTDKKKLQDKLRKLQDAVKFSREEANNTTVTDIRVGDKVFSYLFS
jgi:hypothetical protein